MKMNIKKLLVLGMLSFTLTGSVVATTSNVEAKNGVVTKADLIKIDKLYKINYKTRIKKFNNLCYDLAYKITSSNKNKAVNFVKKQLRAGMPYIIRAKNESLLEEVLMQADAMYGSLNDYKSFCDDEAYIEKIKGSYVCWFGNAYYNSYRDEFMYYPDKSVSKEYKALEKSRKKEKAFTVNKLIPAVYDKYWELLEQGKTVKPMFWGDNGYKNIDISKYPAIGRCIQNGTRPEFNELSEVSQVHILTYFLRRYNFIHNEKKDSFERYSTNSKRLECYLNTIIEKKWFKLRCQTIYFYNELLSRQLGLVSGYKRTDKVEGGHAWGTLTCKDYIGTTQLMECDNSGFELAGRENNGMFDDDTGESTHDHKDMFTYLNSELEYLGY